MLTIYKHDNQIKRVQSEFTALEWLLILKALDRFIHDQNSHADDVALAKKIWNMEQKFVEEQEPFINKPCVSEQSCHEDKTQVLRKIMEEIANENKRQNAIGSDCWENDSHEARTHFSAARAYAHCICIIDKYMKDGEEV